MVLLVALLVLVAGACATPPEPERGAELTAFLPEGQTLYLGLRVAAAEALLDQVVASAGVESRRLESLLDQTDQIVASYGRSVTGEPQMFFVGSGRYGPRRAGLFMRLSRRWSRESAEIDGERYEYWQDRESGLQVSFPNATTMLAATENLAGGMVPRDRARDRFLAPPEIIEQFDTGELSFFMPSPTRWLEDQVGALPFELPILDVRMAFDRGENDDGERDIVGDVRLRSERDARAFTVVFRLMAMTVASEIGFDRPDLLEQLSIERHEDVVRFSGLQISDDRMGRMIGGLLADSAVQVAAPESGGRLNR